MSATRIRHLCPVCREDVTAQVTRKAKHGWVGGPPKKLPKVIDIVGICSRGHYAEYDLTT